VPDDHGSREVTLWTVTWTDDRPELSARTVVIDEYRVPPGEAPQAQEKPLTTGGSRVRSAVCRADSVWFAFAAAHEGGVGASAGVSARWYRLDGVTGALMAQDALGAAGIAYVFPALVVDRSGRLVMAACRAAANEHPSLHYGSWPSSGSASTGLLVRGQGPHLKCRGNVPCSAPDARNGWGDYNGIALDPDDESTAWVFGGVGHETDKSLWATGIVALHP
jgi:hypothetical protein